MMPHKICIHAIGICCIAGLASTTFATASSGLDIEINEVRTEQSGADIDEFIELRGNAGASLDGLTYIVIGDGDSFPPTQNGYIEAVVDLSGNSIGSSGYFVIAEDTFTLGTADLTAALNFEGSDNVSHFLVSGFTGSLNQDLDEDDDGTLDITPWDSILDCFALLKNATPDGNSDEYYYCDETVGPDSGFVPGHAYRCEDTRELRAGAFDLGIDDSPGEANAECGGGGGGGELMITEIRIDQPSSDTDEYFELMGDPNTDLTGLTYVVIGGTSSDPGGKVEAVIPLDGYTIGATGIFWAAEETTSFGTPDAVFTNEIDFQNGQNVTHLLVRDCTAGDNDDLDAENDGILDEPLPWSEVIDDVSVVRTFGSGFLIYSDNTVGPDGSFLPGQVYRCSPDSTWRVGGYDPGDGTDTPGAENLPCPAIQCGGEDPRNCFEARAEPGCSDFSCCSLVNEVDPSCGEVEWDSNCVSIAQSVCLSGNPAPSLVLNEVRMKQGGSDDDEYFELTGDPGTSLDGVSLLVVGGNGVDINGSVETAINLSGNAINSLGYFVAAESTFTLGAADAIMDLLFNDGGNKTLMLVHNFTGTVNGDLDNNDDCTLDATPWDDAIDAVSFISTFDTNCTYANAIAGPDGDYSPGHAYVCGQPGNWGVGTFNVDDENAADTPGAANPDDCDTSDCEECIDRGLDVVACDLLQTYAGDCCNVWDASCDAFVANNLTYEASAPVDVQVVELRSDQIGDDNDEYFELQAAPNTALDGYSVIVIGDGSGGSGQIETRIPLIGATTDENGLLVIADSFTYTLGTPDYDFNFNIENNDNITTLVVYGFSGDDLEPDVDTDDDGLMDVMPWVESTSCVAMLSTDDPESGDLVYCDNQVGPNKVGAPGHIYFDCDLGAWQMGLFDPVGETDTPGVLNNGCETGGPDCVGDFDDNGKVDGADLSALLGAWGTANASIDLTGDGNVDGADLSVLLGAWGDC